MKPICLECGEEIIPHQRYTELKYRTCLGCGDSNAKQRKFTVVPINKSNYMLVTDMVTLKQLNPKRTT